MLDKRLVAVFRPHPEVVFRSHPDVEPSHLSDRTDDRPRPHGGKPRFPMVVVHPYLGHAVAEPLGLYKQFGVHEEPDRLYVYPVDQALWNELEGAVHVPILQVKEYLKDEIVGERGDVAVERVALADAEPYNQLGVAYKGHELLQLSYVELAVAIGVEDVVVLGACETGFEGGPVAAVLLVVDNPDPGMASGQFVGDLARTVGAAVVDDYYLVLAAYLL